MGATYGLGAPPDQATGHMGGGKLSSREGSLVLAGVGSGPAWAGSGGGDSGYSPAGGWGRPAVWAGLPALGATGRI